MRERDRRTYTVVWVAVTAVLALILVVFGSPRWALALMAVAGVGLVAFLRATHPGGRGKPNLNIFFDEVTVPAADLPASRPARPAGPPARSPRSAPPAPRPGADVIDLRQRDRVPVPTVDDAVAASAQAARPATDVSDDLAEHHVRLLRQVHVKLRDYE